MMKLGIERVELFRVSSRFNLGTGGYSFDVFALLCLSFEGE